MRAFFDASALAALVLQEESWEALVSWIGASPKEPVFSDFGRGELASTLAAQERAGLLGPGQAQDSFSQVDEWLEGWLVARMTRRDLAAATDFVLTVETRLRLPDAIHIAMAQRLDATLVSLDKRQVAAAALLNVAAVNPLAIAN